MILFNISLYFLTAPLFSSTEIDVRYLLPWLSSIYPFILWKIRYNERFYCIFCFVSNVVNQNTFRLPFKYLCMFLHFYVLNIDHVPKIIIIRKILISVSFISFLPIILYIMSISMYFFVVIDVLWSNNYYELLAIIINKSIHLVTNKIIWRMK